MSLHVNLSPEAVERLHCQKRNSTISSIVIAALVLTLVSLLLGFYLLPSLVNETPVVVIYDPQLIDEPEVPDPRPVHLQRKPSSPSSVIVRILVSNSMTPISVPVPDEEIDKPTVDFANGDDFGSCWGSGAGGGGGGTETSFGSTEARRNSLKGSLYDFKQKPNGDDVDYNVSDVSEFTERVIRLQRSRFSESKLGRYFRAPNSLYLSHLAIANSLASQGPEFFGAQDSIKSSGWVAVYRGRVAAPHSGFYRFSGLGDDYLVVMVRSRICLSACWPSTQEYVIGRWKPSVPSGKFKSPYDGGMPLIFGDWVKLEKGAPVDIVIAVGERPGGKVGFMLNIEERSREYRKTPDGRPILPLFSIGPVAAEEEARIKKEFGAFEFEWADVPIFEAR